MPTALEKIGDFSQTRITNGTIQPIIDPLTGSGVTTQVWATVDGAGKYLLTPGGSSGLVTWTANSGLPLSGGGPHNVGLEWSFEQTTGTWNGKTCNNRNNNPCKDSGSLGYVQRGFVASEDHSGPLERVQISGPSVTSGANSFQQGTTQTLGVSIAVKGNLQIQSQATDPVIELRVAQTDLGKVIGKQGRTARALRTILNANATKMRKRAVLEIVE